jgi:S-adenosylmethionine:tRNA ribosyltransferase-isomerase
MLAAKRPRARTLENKLLAIDGAKGTLRDLRMKDLPSLVEPSDLVVVNDAATLPASIHGTAPNGAPIEVRLIDRVAADRAEERWRAVVFGAGDWRTPTERRVAPPRIDPGDRIDLAPGLEASVERIFESSPRLVELRFALDEGEVLGALYARGRPVQYSYLSVDLSLEDVQTPYASRPWAVEMPSAGRPLSWSLIFALFDKGVRVRTLTHAAGLSSIGDEALDRILPLPERFEIPEGTVRAIEDTKHRGGHVVAVGTTVVRALEGAARSERGTLRPGRGITDLRIDGGFEPRIADAILTGVHERTASHSTLLEAFAPRALLDDAAAYSDAHGYLGHEFGDSWFIARPNPRAGIRTLA